MKRAVALVLAAAAIAFIASRLAGRAEWAPPPAPAEPGVLVHLDGG